MHPRRRPNPDRSPESLAARLRALSPPPVPAGLEARLLADIPSKKPLPRWRWAVGVGALACACVLALLAWPRRALQGPFPVTAPVVRVLESQRADDSSRIAGWQAARQTLDETTTPAFAWPLQETPLLRVGPSIPPDLLD